MVSLLAGCEKEKQNKDVNGGGFYLYSSINESNTRVSLEDNETSAVVTRWEIGDEVAVQFYDGETGSDVYTFTVVDFEDEGHKIAKMRSGEGIEIPDGADIYAWYPASTALNTEVDLSASQDGTLETIHGKNVLATTTPTKYVDGQIIRLYFEHLTSIIKMTLTKSTTITNVDPGLLIKGINYGYKLDINPADRTMVLTPSVTGDVRLDDFTVGTTMSPVYTLIAPGKTFKELDVAANGYAYDELSHQSVSVPMGLTFINNNETEIIGGLTYIISQEMSFAQPGASDFKAYYFRSNDTEDEVIAHGNSKVYFLSDGRYHEMESVPGLAEACEIVKVEGTENKYEVILNRNPEVRVPAYIKIPAVIITRYSSSLKRSVSFVVLYDDAACTTQFRKEYDKASNQIITTNNYYYLEAL